NCDSRAHRANRPVGPRRVLGLRLHRPRSTTCAPAPAGRARCWSWQDLLPGPVHDRSIRTAGATARGCCHPDVADTETGLAPYGLLHVLDFFGHGEEGGMPIYLAVGRLEQRFLVARTAGDHIGGSHHPDAQTLVAPRIDIACIVDCHFGVGRMQTAYML